MNHNTATHHHLYKPWKREKRVRTSIFTSNNINCTNNPKNWQISISNTSHSIWAHTDHPFCTLVQAMRLCIGRTAYRGSRGIALPFHDHGTRRGWGVSVTPRLLFTPGKHPVPIVQEAGWAPGPVWTGAENLAPTGIRSPDRPARSQSLYRLSYPAHWSSFSDM